MTRSKLSIQHISLKAPLQFDVYDERGYLLLRRGYLIDSADQLRRLVDRGLYRDQAQGWNNPVEQSRPLLVVTPRHREPPPKRLTAFGLVRALVTDLELQLSQPMAGTFEGDMMALATRLSEACTLNGDALIGAIQLFHEGRYSVRRLFQTAVLVELVLRGLREAPDQRLVVVAATLSSNIAMLRLQDELYALKGPLSPEQQQAIQKHPAQGVAQLKALGVRDPRWLNVVMQHHEAPDGKGYPLGLDSATLTRDAQVVAMCDRFTSLCNARAHRPSMVPADVLKGMFVASAPGQGGELTTLLIKVTGLYPPGTVVRLANEDWAVVVTRTQSIKHPVVKSLKARNGPKFDAPRKHLSSESIYAITSLARASDLGFAMDPDLLWSDTYAVCAPAAAAATPPGSSGEANAGEGHP